MDWSTAISITGQVLLGGAAASLLVAVVVFIWKSAQQFQENKHLQQNSQARRESDAIAEKVSNTPRADRDNLLR